MKLQFNERKPAHGSESWDIQQVVNSVSQLFQFHIIASNNDRRQT